MLSLHDHHNITDNAHKRTACVGQSDSQRNEVVACGWVDQVGSVQCGCACVCVCAACSRLLRPETDHLAVVSDRTACCVFAVNKIKSPAGWLAVVLVYLSCPSLHSMCECKKRKTVSHTFDNARHGEATREVARTRQRENGLKSVARCERRRVHMKPA